MGMQQISFFLSFFLSFFAVKLGGEDGLGKGGEQSLRTWLEKRAGSVREAGESAETVIFSVRKVREMVKKSGRNREGAGDGKFVPLPLPVSPLGPLPINRHVHGGNVESRY